MRLCVVNSEYLSVTITTSSQISRGYILANVIPLHFERTQSAVPGFVWGVVWIFSDATLIPYTNCSAERNSIIRVTMPQFLTGVFLGKVSVLEKKNVFSFFFFCKNIEG